MADRFLAAARVVLSARQSAAAQYRARVHPRDPLGSVPLALTAGGGERNHRLLGVHDEVLSGLKQLARGASGQRYVKGVPMFDGTIAPLGLGSSFLPFSVSQLLIALGVWPKETDPAAVLFGRLLRLEMTPFEEKMAAAAKSELAAAGEPPITRKLTAPFGLPPDEERSAEMRSQRAKRVNGMAMPGCADERSA